jgi:NAD(P) transhydrogenase subunit beta
MTAMPEMVALFNGFGGIASMLVAGAVYHHYLHDAVIAAGEGDVTEQLINLAILADNSDPLQTYIATVASGIVGAVTFTGSMIAFVKLREWISGRPMTNPVLKFSCCSWTPRSGGHTGRWRSARWWAACSS